MNKTLAGIVVTLVVLVGGLYIFNSYKPTNTPVVGATDYKHAQYLIEGHTVTLGTNATYFGNELKTDLDGDGREDVAFIITYSPGGSGTFYYAVAALNTDHGYVGSDGYLLGDRIAPQSTTLSPNPNQVHVVVFNYADRAAGEPMTARPSVGKSAYLKLNSATMQWGVVVPNFEGESNVTPHSQTIVGYWECLPHKNTTGPQTTECALGIAVDQSDGHYAINTSLMQTYPVDFPTGTKVKVTGVVTPANQVSGVQKYDIDGVINATTIEKL